MRLPSLGSLALLAILVVALLSGGDEGGSGEREGRGEGRGRENAGDERSGEPGDRRTGAGDDDRPGAGGEPERGVLVPVLDIVDGDTIEVRYRGGEEDVRYIGVDTPESVAPGQPVECFGPEASAFNAELVAGETVRLVFDAEERDHYGRLLAYVYVGERFVNAELLRRGYATTLTIAPNDLFARRFDRIEQAAGNAGRGLWSECL